MLIDANHLQLTLKGQPVLHDVSLHLESGQIYGLLGPNGAGKSTTIATLLGLYVPNNGTLALFDKTQVPEQQVHSVQIRSQIGVMPERAGFYEWMSAGDYLSWYGGFYGGLMQPLPELLELVGLEGRQHQMISQFSHGMRQRLALARALLHGPELLILDEPTNGLDPRGRREIHDLLLNLANSGNVGIVLCTHLLDDVDRLCSHIGIIKNGSSVLEGSLESLLATRAAMMRFRLRLERPPEDPKHLPPGVNLLGRDGRWWIVSVNSAEHLPVSQLWLDLLEHGWAIAEVRSERGGLEELYLKLTSTSMPVEEVI
ncbi:MAG: ABC transporter ATP-binding protein [Thiotrichales bacterium]